MSQLGRTTFVQWYKGLPLGPINSGTNGQAEGGTWPAVFDQFTATLDAARKVAFPDYAPADALPYLGNDRKLIQGANESNASFVTRLKDAWGQWSRAGTACSVLEQLWYYGLTGAYWIQQNGLYCTFGNSTLTPGQDPTSLLQSGNTSTLASALTSTTAPYRSIPAGTPWFSFDGNTDLTNRFAIILPSFPFSVLAFAYFNNSDTATVTWPVPFASTASLLMINGPATDRVVVNVDGTSVTNFGATLIASAPWTGVVYVIAWPFGSTVNPLNVFSSASVGTVKSIISKWRPNAICAGVYVIQSGRMWDWPVTTWDGLGGQWDAPSSVYQILGAF